MNPNIVDYLPRYPPIEATTFNKDFNNLYEFKNPVVPKTESFPTSKGERMSHQIIISRIMSSRTPYDGMLLMHDMGTGKTCTAVSIIEQIRSETDSGIKKFYYVAKNNDLGANFDYQYRNVCVKGTVKNTGVQTKTYTKFLDEFKDNNNLEGSVVVIDEVHNIKTMINEYTKILTNPKIRNLKVVLLSGTPMTDDPREIEDIMNLITRDRSTHVKREPGYYNNLTPDKIEELRKLFRGRVSYLKSMETKGFSTTMKESDKPLETFKHFKIYPSEMSTHQLEFYKAALRSDLGEVGSIIDQPSDTKSAAYSNSRQASNFVDENGNYTIDQLKTIRMNIKGGTDKEKLQQLRKYSAKYADSMEVLIAARNDRKNVFVYNRFVKGGGLFVFKRILDIFGFKSTRVGSDGVVAATPNPKRYMEMTGSTTPSDKQQLVERFNRPDNIDGAYIGIVLVSDAISEGYTFKNIQVVDIHSPWFQYAKITQAIARGIRLGSHNALLQRDGQVNVEIYLRASTLPAGADVESIDIKTYSIAEKKDIAVKQIEYIIKQEAVDAVAMKARNTRGSEYDGKRECEYTTCDYVTHPGRPSPIGGNNDDYSNFQIYYNLDDTGLRNSIVDMFAKVDSIRFVDIVQNTVKNTIPVLAALYTLINANTPVIRNGVKFYIREDKDIYYLTTSIGNNTTSLDLYYNSRDIQTTLLKWESDVKFEIMDILSDTSVKTVDDLVALFVKNSDTVTVADKERLLEAFIVGSPVEDSPVEEFFSGLYGNIGGVMYSWYPKHATKLKKVSLATPCRKYTGGGWVDVSEEEFEKIIKPYIYGIKATMQQKAKSKYEEMTESSVPKTLYYGLYNYKEDKAGSSREFKIMAFETSGLGVDDRREENTGVNCKSFKFNDNTGIFNAIGIMLGEKPKKSTKDWRCDPLEKAMAMEGLLTRFIQHI